MGEMDVLEDSAFEIAPCLHTGPLALRASAVVRAARALGSSGCASVLRAWCVPYVFENMERIFAGGEEPLRAIDHSLETLEQFLLAAARSGLGELGGSQRSPRTDVMSASIEEATGEHYGRLFRSFSLTSFWDEPVHLLRTRLERNGVATVDLGDQEVLDAGCGGGRY